MLDEQRRGILNQTVHSLGMQEPKTASAVQNVEQPLQQRFMELSSRNYDHENSRGSQLRLLAEL